MAATFNLADLIPEPMTFRDVDGTAYEAHTPEMFGAVDFARLTRLRTDMTAAFSALQVKQGDPDQAERLAANLEDLADRLIAMIVPELPIERRTTIAFGHKFRFLNWWKEQQQKAALAVEVKAGRESDPGAMLARLVRFYHIDPQDVLTTPQYLLAVLCDYLPALEAYEQRAAITSSVAPHLKGHAYRDLLWDLNALAAPLSPPPEPPERETYEHAEPNPAAAAEWFKAMGANVVKKADVDVEVA